MCVFALRLLLACFVSSHLGSGHPPAVKTRRSYFYRDATKFTDKIQKSLVEIVLGAHQRTKFEVLLQRPRLFASNDLTQYIPWSGATNPWVTRPRVTRIGPPKKDKDEEDYEAARDAALEDYDFSKTTSESSESSTSSSTDAEEDYEEEAEARERAEEEEYEEEARCGAARGVRAALRTGEGGGERFVSAGACGPCPADGQRLTFPACFPSFYSCCSLRRRSRKSTRRKWRRRPRRNSPKRRRCGGTHPPTRTHPPTPLRLDSASHLFLAFLRLDAPSCGH